MFSLLSFSLQDLNYIIEQKFKLKITSPEIIIVVYNINKMISNYFIKKLLSLMIENEFKNNV